MPIAPIPASTAARLQRFDSLTIAGTTDNWSAALDLADNWLNFVRLELTVYTDNAVALALYRKFGFEVEGTLKSYAFRNGRFIDAYTMARISPSHQEGNVTKHKRKRR